MSFFCEFNKFTFLSNFYGDIRFGESNFKSDSGVVLVVEAGPGLL